MPAPLGWRGGLIRHLGTEANQVLPAGQDQGFVDQPVVLGSRYWMRARCMAFSWGLQGTYTGSMVRGSRPGV